MDGKIQLRAPNLAPEQVRDISASLLKDLVAELGLDARLATESGSPGDRGDPVTIGMIIVSLVKSGAILGFTRLLQTYISRVPSLELTIARSDGQKIQLKSTNFTDEQLDKTLTSIQHLIET
jgi:Effector Associated Constant Component 1